MASTAPALGNLVRLSPLQLPDLPAHPSLPDTASAVSNSRPALLPFLLALLADGSSFLSPSSFQSTFTKQSTKTSSDTANVPVEVHKRDVPSSEIQNIAWTSDSYPVKRAAPKNVQTEHWFSRHSRHKNVSSATAEKEIGQMSADWDEFVYGLRDQHSKHEFDFTPTLYDAHHVLDWNQEIRRLEAEGAFEKQVIGYSKVTMSIYEMCHAIPAPLQPRCFPVLVVTASTGPKSFVAVTVPVNLGATLAPAFYSTKRNLKEGRDAQQKKEAVLGVYTAVETVYMDGDTIDWTMATASDTKGNLPMFAQKMGLPGAVVKDVGLFLKWIKTVDKSEIMAQGPGTDTAR